MVCHTYIPRVLTIVILCNRFDCISEKVIINLPNVLQADQSYLGTKLALLFVKNIIPGVVHNGGCAF